MGTPAGLASRACSEISAMSNHERGKALTTKIGRVGIVSAIFANGID